SIQLVRPRSPSGVRRGCASCGRKTKTVAKTPTPLLRCMVYRQRRSLTCSASCAPRRARASCLVRPARNLSRSQNLARGRSRPLPRRKQDPDDDKVTGADIIAFIEEVCFIPEGKYVGKKFELFEWQKAEIRRIYDNPHGTRRAIISMGRKNAKTTLAACL